MTGLFRRGGMWWARMTVPHRLRHQAGRREFVQSTGSREHSVGKLVAAVLLAGWRRALYELERGIVDSENLLKLVDGSPALSGQGYLTFKRASEETGLDRQALLNAIAGDRLRLYYRVGLQADGYVLQLDQLDPIEPELGSGGGFIVPRPGQMPIGAQRASFPGEMLLVPDGATVAGVVLAESLGSVKLVTFAAPQPKGWLFVPNEVQEALVDDLALSVSQVDALRLGMAAGISHDRIEHARSERRGKQQADLLRDTAVVHAFGKGQASPQGKWAQKRFSAALDAYCSSSNGLPSTLGSVIEQRQRKAGLLVFTEFMGDLPLAQIDGDVLRQFRDGPLKTIPGRANTLPKTIKQPTMKATIEAIQKAGLKFPLLSIDAQHERMQWLARFFEWLHSKEYIVDNPAAPLRSETGMTKIELKAARRAQRDDDEAGREPFTSEQLQLIFGQRHYQTGNGEHIRKPAHWYGFEYWLPLLGIYCGLRLKEASQLHLDDIEEVEGVWCINVNERTPDKSLKNETAKRVIPLHPELLRLGFVDYREKLAEAGFQRFFPELSWSTSDAKYAKEPGRKMSAMLKSLGMERDGKLVFHCLRHNANNALARVPAALVLGADENLRKFIRYYLMGHQLSKDDVNARHYTSTWVTEKTALIGGVAHGIPTIHPFDSELALQRVQIALGKKQGSRRGSEDMGPLMKLM